MPTILGDGKIVSRMYVSRKAVMQRVNRALAKEGRMIRKARSSRIARSLGDFFLVDPRRRNVIEQNIDLEKYARELECLAKWEALELEPQQKHAEGCRYDSVGRYTANCPACLELAREYERREGKL